MSNGNEESEIDERSLRSLVGEAASSRVVLYCVALLGLYFSRYLSANWIPIFLVQVALMTWSLFGIPRSNLAGTSGDTHSDLASMLNITCASALIVPVMISLSVGWPNLDQFQDAVCLSLDLLCFAMPEQWTFWLFATAVTLQIAVALAAAELIDRGAIEPSRELQLQLCLPINVTIIALSGFIANVGWRPLEFGQASFFFFELSSAGNARASLYATILFLFWAACLTMWSRLLWHSRRSPSEASRVGVDIDAL